MLGALITTKESKEGNTQERGKYRTRMIPYERCTVEKAPKRTFKKIMIK